MRIVLTSVILDLKRRIFGHHTGILKFTGHILGSCVINDKQHNSGAQVVKIEVEFSTRLALHFPTIVLG